jgi:hypothetical protein
MLALLTLCASLGASGARGAAIEAEQPRRVENAEFGAPAPGLGAVCEAPRCSAVDGDETCTACRVWDYASAGLDENTLTFESRIIENGVVLRATSQDVQVQQLLWTVSVARHQVLEILRGGGRVPLCAPCHANVQAFAEVEVGASRLPDGVLLMYTSSNPDIVGALHAMLLSGQDMPL